MEEETIKLKQHGEEIIISRQQTIQLEAAEASYP